MASNSPTSCQCFLGQVEMSVSLNTPTQHKWQSSQPNVNPGTVVVPKDIHFPRNEWPLGLVIKVFPSTDGKVCTVEIRVAGPHGTELFTRPFSQIVVLFPPEL